MQSHPSADVLATLRGRQDALERQILELQKANAALISELKAQRTELLAEIKELRTELKEVRTQLRENEKKHVVECELRHRPHSIRLRNLENTQDQSTIGLSRNDLERMLAALKRELSTATTDRDQAVESEQHAKHKAKSAVAGAAAAIAMSLAVAIIEIVKAWSP